MRVALLDHDEARRLAAALGSDATLVRAARLDVAEALLSRRGFTGPLSHVPLATVRLLKGSFDVAHAFTPSDAAAALFWRRRTGRPVVFTNVEPLTRASVADRRLRARLLADAVEQSDVVVAASDDAREGLRRWMAVDAPVLSSDDAGAYAQLYAALRP